MLSLDCCCCSTLQFDVTEVVLAERRVKQLQKQQMNLLKEMLPPQVRDAGHKALEHHLAFA